MRQEFQDGFQHTVYPLATAVSSVPTSSVVNPPSDAMEECIDSPTDALEDDDYEDDDIDEDDVSLDEQPATTTTTTTSEESCSFSPRRAIEAKQIAQQQPLASSATEAAAAASSAPQALFLNFTSDLEPHVNVRGSSKPKKTPAFKVNGVNLLNRKNVDSKTAIERIQRRRENHNHVERRRRDNINNTIIELSRMVPHAVQHGQKLNKGKVLKMALDHILVRLRARCHDANPYDLILVFFWGGNRICNGKTDYSGNGRTNQMRTEQPAI
ncbi:hypothetical protein BDB00DRAFT_860084 [Zychaea mexicana]|uniref:uncharacterized protein n=1 Tax=Zychaea mexicana TaxID=64656 RepID=UPI0022FF24EF|nr:uncharacterized protein BDB00DRAFT_860084 [Zychaea mexicana]KAI9474887.1 hypothetical protein BDB00DRAFT_860084 [Zychaea mexicana]